MKLNVGSNLTDLAEYIGVSLPSMSKLVDNLTYRGLIDRQPDAKDRRRVRLSLTEAGLAELAAAREAAKASFAVRLTQLDPGDIAAVIRSLQMLHRLFGITPVGEEAPDTSEGVANCE